MHSLKNSETFFYSSPYHHHINTSNLIVTEHNLSNTSVKYYLYGIKLKFHDISLQFVTRGRLMSLEAEN